MKKCKIGIQLYTLRDALTADYRGVLRELAARGCEGVEFAWNFGGMEPYELAAFLRECRLSACGIHASDEELANPEAKIYDYAKALGVKYVTLSHCGVYPAQLAACLSECRVAGGVAAQKGFTLTYHNHADEFALQDAKSCLEWIYEAMDSSRVMGEPDVCWIAKGGANPVDWIRRYADRVPQIHFKDMDETGDFTELGHGVVPLADCVAAARDSICEWLIYEQDVCKRPQLESAAESLAHLRKLLGRSFVSSSIK